MIKFSVNVNKIATVRNSRGGSIPNVVDFARAAIEAGADGITVHPRPDERHITRQDVLDLRNIVTDVEFNIEGYPNERYIEIVQTVRPDQATLVPDPPEALTSNAGWNLDANQEFLKDVIAELKKTGTRVSLFMEPDPEAMETARAVGADRIELYTEHFARAFAERLGEASFAEYVAAAEAAVRAGLGVNAGHDLNLDNLVLMRQLPGLLEVSIGHALVNDALWMGWRKAIGEYLKVLRG